MRLAVFSDLHGNLEALQAFIERIKTQDVDRLCCLGDLVGYGPNPNECVETVRSLPKVNVVLGNHDWAAYNPGDTSFDLNPVALEAIQWTQTVLSTTNMDYLKGLPPMIDMGQFTFVHTSAYKPFSWQYLVPGRNVRVWMCFRFAAGRIVFTGHTHVPVLMDDRGRSLLPECDFRDGFVHTDDGKSRLLVNPGSLGQPRDRMSMPSYVIYDTETKTVSWHRILRYDCHITIRKILSSGLPPGSAHFLLD
jgi:predicted phosphodiesterase